MTGPATRIAPRPRPEGDPASFVVMGWGGPGGITPYGLARRSLGSQVLWLFGVSASAPMTVLAGGTVATFAATGVIAVPLSFPLLAVALGLFAIGYTRLARDVPHAAPTRPRGNALSVPPARVGPVRTRSCSCSASHRTG